MKIQLSGKILLSLLFLFTYSLFAESTWQSGYVNLKDGYRILAEYSIDNNGNYYLRQGKSGHLLEKSKVISIVDKQYVDLISNSSPYQSGIESIFFLRSGATYTTKSAESKKKEDLTAFGIKSVSIASMIFFFSEAISDQRRVKNSTYLLDYDKSRAKFYNSRNNMNYSIALFLVISAYYAIDAYLNFDTDLYGEKTNTYNSIDIGLDEYLKSQFPESKSGFLLDRQSSSLFSYEKSFYFNF
ncbi:hypothetical protein [Leptospira levettii]|uniref:DUF5683 domain-containing protein n=1 Tax=Leptospira levettii TaxID=2023178 RepID=A0ABY2MU13_9LEPT|nr:hypothetical protein [Leptospira levettii]TGL75417.1 hypothetical protein EHQ60_00400 [Leptospira levettii]